MQEEINSQIIRRYFNAYKTKNRAEVELLLADGFTFTSPYDDAIDRATYFERCWPNSEHRGETILERVAAERNEVFVTYLAVTNERMEFRNTEFFVFAGDQIASVDVYFGATYKDGAFQKQQ
jgi:ketosteroid isomerase-like protein